MEQIQIGGAFKRKVPGAVRKIKSTKQGESGFEGDRLTLRLLRNSDFRRGAQKLIKDFPETQIATETCLRRH